MLNSTWLLVLLVAFGRAYCFSPVSAVIQPQPTRLRRLRRYYNSYLTSRPRRPTSLSAHERPLIAGNWKLNPGTLGEATTLLKLLHANFVNHRTTLEADVVVFPPTPFLATAVSLLEGSGIAVGAQSVSAEADTGAYTGEVSARMVRSLGVSHVLLGHSERRILYGETNESINLRVKNCLEELGLQVILCVGETQDEYEAGCMASVVDVQVRKCLQGVPAAQMHRIVIAYEPVWAIGTGLVATPEQTQVAHEAIRSTLISMYGANVANEVRIQYGGSVNADNVQDLLSMPDVNGALVGGASLTADSFTRIVDGAAAQAKGDSLYERNPIELTAIECVPVRNILGESPVWSTRDQALYWISAPEEEVWTWDLVNPAYRRKVGTQLGCLALMESSQPGTLVLAGESAFLKIQMSADSHDFAAPAILCDRPERDNVSRPNDGRVDRQGRFVFGMYNNYHRTPVGDANVCGIYRVNDGLECEPLLDVSTHHEWGEYRVSNCICFSPGNGETMYFCDTPTRKLYAFDYPTNFGKGELANRRLIWTQPPEWPGGPDGAQTDADGFVWVALSGAAKVVRIDPTSGNIDMVVHLPVKSPTSVTFGGPELDELFITTRGPDGGGLYRVKMPLGIRGLPEPEFRTGRQATVSSWQASSPGGNLMDMYTAQLSAMTN